MKVQAKKCTEINSFGSFKAYLVVFSLFLPKKEENKIKIPLVNHKEKKL